jgi:hypothetical protein
MTQSRVGGLHCGSRIAWPLRRIANPVVSHRGSSNLPCRAINIEYRKTENMLETTQLLLALFILAVLLLIKPTRHWILVVLFSYKVIWKYLNLRPSNERPWVNDNKETASATFDGTKVKLRNVRDFAWTTTREFEERWVTMEFDTTDVKDIWFVLEYFDPTRKQLAHTILSFEFEDGRFLSCSIEARREEGERYHPITGMFRQFELIYVWGTEADLIGVRTRCRKKSKTHLFRAKLLREDSKQALLESYLKRTNKLSQKPEWYNSISNTCTTNIARHVNDVYPGRIPKSFAVLLPGLSPKLLEKNQLVELNGLTMDELLIASLIDEKAQEWDEISNFSAYIRS